MTDTGVREGTLKTRRQLVRAAVATSIALAGAAYVSPKLTSLGVPLALAASGPLPPPPPNVKPSCLVTWETGDTGGPVMPETEPNQVKQYNNNFYGEVTVGDVNFGVLTIEVVTNTNFQTAVPNGSGVYAEFGPGQLGIVSGGGNKNPFYVWAARVNPSQGAQLVLKVTSANPDATNNTFSCDPDVLGLTSGTPLTINLPGSGAIQVDNGTPGLQSLEVSVNGQSLSVGNLQPGEVRTLQIAAANDGSGSTLTLTGYGDSGTGALILLLEAST